MTSDKKEQHNSGHNMHLEQFDALNDSEHNCVSAVAELGLKSESGTQKQTLILVKKI